MIDWKKFEETNYVSLDIDTEKDLKLTNWDEITKEQNGETRYGIGFNCISEDGKEINKKFETTSKRMIRKLKPIILKAEEQNKTEIHVKITRVGEKFDTNYLVKEVNDGT